ncbi:helix-turn-helix domain-containing protein [Mycobacterium sp. 852014-50255_SCH5639931]|uniref:helix-turn-helix domain-containing protein n=1 Tax=Mycobacterium sp. 852014-50255_SCH5639931 TaxID=1834112 RepID=UPI0008018530|nr:helix-turn-helix domain-containing protein [Mycobacterium sp. 852014-50255_SCH5639931]OBB63654.1 hypothetical protein A5758_21790 [Mycobacterium sp. 852014-50255_SCH5639931]
MEGQPSRQYYTVKEFAELTLTSKITVYRHIWDRTLPHIKIGNTIRIPASALDILDGGVA